jgi:tRNA threonylcarbamoyl adenosine modification protein (Sua5/YciO/YrdC/YwlC family)
MVAASEAIRKGELIVLPTDTVYGVGADAFTPWAVSRLLAAKGRGRDMPPPVLVGTVRAATALVDDFGPFGQDLIDEFWPGGLTLVARAQPTLAWDLGETKGTVAVRMPLHAGALDLLKATGPMAVSSANTTGRPAANTVDEAMEQLGDSISVYLDGGPCGGGVASTIIDLTGSVPRLLRAGAISMDRLREVAALITGDEAEETPIVNGTDVLGDPDGTTGVATPGPANVAEDAVPAGPPDIPSDSPADLRADALAAGDLRAFTEAFEAPGEPAPADSPAPAGSPVKAESAVTAESAATEEAAAPETAPKTTRARKPAAPRKPATPRKPAARKTTTRTTKPTTAAAAAETPAEADSAAAVDTPTAATPAGARATPVPEATGAPATPRKTTTRKPASERKATATRRTAARNATAATPAEPAPSGPAEDTGDPAAASAPDEAGPARPS